MTEHDPTGKGNPPGIRPDPAASGREPSQADPFSDPPPSRDPFGDPPREAQPPAEAPRAPNLVEQVRRDPAHYVESAPAPEVPPPTASPDVRPGTATFPPGYNPMAERLAPAPLAPEKRGWFGRGRAKPATSQAGSAGSPPPPPPDGRRRLRRSERSRSPFIAGANAAFTILLLLLFGAAAVVHYGIKAYNEPGPLQAETDIVIPRGAGPRDIGERLQQAGAISSSTVFLAGVQMTGNRGKLKAGEYRIPAHASMSRIVNMIAEGDVIAHTVTIPEGLTSRQIVNRLLEETILSGSIREVPPEGTLLPETYQVTRGTERQALLERMAAEQKKVLDEVWEKRDPSVPVKSPVELVTLASIVEKETGIASERPRVAAVFANRLNKKMRLQSDPTIIYGLVQGAGTLGRPILRSEIVKPTPYNTYTIPGLPPGPIANPGRASLEAAANPAKTKDLYFVADGSGGHAFAETLQQHNENVAKWRKLQRAADNDRAPVDVEAAPSEPAAPPPPRNRAGTGTN